MSQSTPRNPLATVALLAGLMAGGGYFLRHFEVRGIDQLTVHAKSTVTTAAGVDNGFIGASSATWPLPGASDLFVTPVSASHSSAAPGTVVPALPATRNLRIASWALAGLGPEKLDSIATLDRIVGVIRGFDLIAVQQLRTSQRDFVPTLLSRASGDGRQYDYVLGPVQQPSGEQLGFFFDTNRVVTDRSQLYSVADPDQRLSHDPLVGWFRASGLAPEAAWTFSFINVRIELSMARRETAELARVLAAVERDGRGEDDCLMGGLFQADDTYLLSMLGQPALATAIKGTPTDILARHQTSNLIFNNATTTEAIGRGGVVDFLRSENLSLAEAEKVSPYLPVYGEFVPREGGVE